MRELLAASALFSGGLLAVQVGLNSELRARMGHPLWAAFTSFAIGTVALAAYLVLARANVPRPGEMVRGPWWMWAGGLVGAVYVAAAAAFASRLGAAPWLGLIVTGQILTSLALDHFGLVGFAPHPITPARILGAVLLLAGVVVVLRS